MTFLWGPDCSEKTRVLAHAAAGYVKNGRKVLFVAPSGDTVDAALLKVVELGDLLGLKMKNLAARAGFSSPDAFAAITPYSFDHQVEYEKG